MSADHTSHFSTGAPEVARDAVALAQALRRFLDAAAAMKPDGARVASLVEDLHRWSARLEADAGSEDESLWRKARRDQPPALLPSLTFVVEGDQLRGRVAFGRFYVGRGAAHGGAIGLVFDEVMGALSGSGGRNRGRTAYLHVDFRAVTPIDRDLSLHAWFEAEEGRKRVLKATLSDGDVLCAQAHGLWLELKPGQP